MNVNINNMEKKLPSFEGFLSNNAPSIEEKNISEISPYPIKKLVELSSDLKPSLTQNGFGKMDEFDKKLHSLNKEFRSVKVLTTEMIDYGNFLLDEIIPKQITQDSVNVVKSIIYNFLKIAINIEDRELKQMAIKLGDEYKSHSTL